MPLYEYECDQCGMTFEVMQKFSDAPLSAHEVCGGRLRRLISPPGLQFKGTGWYITDYSRKGGNGSEKGGSEKTSSEKKSETAKPAESPSKAAEKSK